MKTVLHYLRPRLGIMSVGLLIKFFGTVAELLLPWMLSVILDEDVYKRQVQRLGPGDKLGEA